MKILYAASNRKNAGEQLNRFLQFNKHTIKIAAYKGIKCSRSIDWNLTALLNFLDPNNNISFENDNLEIYYQQIKYYAPDLIISDLEPFTSYIATILNVPIYQVSSQLLWEGMNPNEKMGIASRYQRLFSKTINIEIIKNIIDNADRKLVYSHLCDLPQSLKLKNGFEYIRPYHYLGQISPTCSHQIVSVSSNNDRKLIQLLQQYKDAVLFSSFLDEEFSNIVLKEIDNVQEYACNIKNSQFFLHWGSEDQLADAFYNGKFSWIIPNFTDQEIMINALITNYLNLGHILFDLKEEMKLTKLETPTYNENISFLHEII